MAMNDSFDELARLLPFYVNGTLGAADRGAVDAALARSADLRAELAAVQKLAQTVKASGASLAAAAGADPQRLAAVLDRIEDTPLAPAAPQPEKADLGKLLAFLSPKRWHPAITLSLALAVGAQTILIGNLTGARRSSDAQVATLTRQVDDLQFKLASGPDAAHPASIVVQLRADAPWASVEALFGTEGLSIVDGPSDGALTLSSKAKGTALYAQIARLRASPLIAAADKAA